MDFVSDLIAGIGVACMLVPQALAYAILAGLPPIYGLYTAWLPIIVFGCLSTSKHVAFGPDALGSLLVGLTITSYTTNTDEAIAYTAILSLMVGLFLLALGLVRFGFIDNVLSRPLLCGFVNAVAIIILINQMVTLFGISKTHAETSVEILEHVFKHIHEINWTTFLIGVLTLVVLGGLRFLKNRFPNSTFIKFLIGNLIVVIIGIIMSYSMNFDKRKSTIFLFFLLFVAVEILGDIPSQFPVPVFPPISLKTVSGGFFEAIVIAIIGFIETMAAAKIYATKHGYQVSPNRELVAMGVANTFGAFFRAYPTFGSLTRTAMADYYGAKSQVYTLIASCIVLATIFFLGPIFYYLPRVTMSGIIIVAAISLFEFHDIIFLWKIRAWPDIAQFSLTFFGCIILGPEIGIFLAIGLALLLMFLKSQEAADQAQQPSQLQQNSQTQN